MLMWKQFIVLHSSVHRTEPQVNIIKSKPDYNYSAMLPSRLSKNVQIKIYRSLILSSALYGCLSHMGKGMS
jgi:hypothetical protein